MSNLQKIAFQGVPGAYSHLSCQAFCPDWEPVAYDSFSGMLRAVQNGECSYAMVPVENSTAGRVADIHHMLPESGLHIIAEHFQPVKHHLLGIKGTKISHITKHLMGLFKGFDGAKNIRKYLVSLSNEVHPLDKYKNFLSEIAI